MHSYSYRSTTAWLTILFIAVSWLAIDRSPLTAQTMDDHAFVGATLLPISGPPIERGVMLVRNGVIHAIGPAGEIAIPASAQVHDVSGKVIMPGLICTHSHVGGIGAADQSSPIQPGVRVVDSLNVRDSGYRRALAGGLTTLNVMPGSGHLVGGQTVYLKLRYANGTPSTIDELFYRSESGEPLGGLKMANGTNPQGDPPFPGTRGRSAFLVREQFIEAREYQEKIERANGDAEKMPPRDLDLEVLVEAMQGRRVVHHHTHRHDDIVTVLRLSREFGFPVVLHHVSDAWQIADVIADSQAPCSIILVDSPGGKLEARHLSMSTGGVLEQAGVRVAFHTDDWITDSRLFLRMAALGVRGGMSREKALEAVTLAGAEMLGLEHRIGSLEVGKDADFVVLNGDPLSVYTKVEQTWVEGQMAFDRSLPNDRLYSVGGFGAGHDQSPYFCCFGIGLEAGQ